MIVPLANLTTTLAPALPRLHDDAQDISFSRSFSSVLGFAERKNEKRHSGDSRIPSETPKIVSSRAKNKRSSRRIRGRKAHAGQDLTGRKEEPRRSRLSFGYHDETMTGRRKTSFSRIYSLRKWPRFIPSGGARYPRTECLTGC